MKKSVIVNFFKWWFSIHPSNIAVSEDWLNLEKRLKEKKGGKPCSVYLIF